MLLGRLLNEKLQGNLDISIMGRWDIACEDL
jgi:hypothetical protein